MFEQFEREEISREELQSIMAIHARGLISEIEEDHRHPKSSYLERLRNFAAARKWSKRHGPATLREILSALGKIPHFPPAQILWNADHADVPLHCFFRMRREPIFRITRLSVEPMRVEISIEYGLRAKERITREKITFQRNAFFELELAERTAI